MQAKVDAYKKTVARYESEPDTREGKKELLAAGARSTRQLRDRALKQDPVFRLRRGVAADRHRADLGRDRRQSGLAVVSSAARSALVGMLLSINGFLLLVEVPGLS